MEELFDRIENDFVESIKNKINNKAKMSTTDLKNLPPDQTVPNDDSTKHWTNSLDLLGLDHFDNNSKKDCHTEHIEYLITRGMLAIRKLTKSPSSIARKMVLKSAGLVQYKLNLPFALRDSEYRTESSFEDDELVAVKNTSEIEKNRVIQTLQFWLEMGSCG